MRSTFFVLLASAVATFASAQVQPSQVLPETEPSPAALRDVYDAGLARIFSAIPQTQQPDELQRGLLQLRSIHESIVGWAEFRGESFYAVASGRWVAWVIVVPHGHTALEGMNGPFDFLPNPDFNVLLIRPEAISETWSGLTLLHWLSHSADRVALTQGQGNDEPEYAADFRAYRLQREAADLLTGRAFTQEVDRILDGWIVTSVEEVTRRAVSLGPELDGSLGAIVDVGPPQSGLERSVRRLFLAASLVQRYCEREGLGLSDFGRGMEAMGDRISF